MVGEGVEDRRNWAETCRREAAIRDLLNRYPKRLKGRAVDHVAWELGVSRATLYRLITRYRMTRTVEGLSGPGRGRRAGTRFLSPAKETLIREIIEREYLKPTRPPVRRVLEDIGLACRRHGWSAPTWRTVRSAEPADLVALAFALRAEPAALLDNSFNGVPGPVLNFISPWAKLRECLRCSVEFRVRGTIAVLRQWCVAFAVTCRRCGQSLIACQWSYRWAEDDAAAIERRSARLCASLELGLRDVRKAVALARVMAALATPLPVASRGLSHRADRPLLWRSPFYRREAGSKTRAADPGRPFACWSVPAQLAAICLLEEVVCDDLAWGQIADRELVDGDDRNVIRDLLGRFGRAAEPGSRAPCVQSSQTLCPIDVCHPSDSPWTAAQERSQDFTFIAA